MPTVDLTPRLARDSRPGARDTILFDRTLPGFGLRVHSSGRKVWIVQTRILPAFGKVPLAPAATPPRSAAGRGAPRTASAPRTWPHGSTPPAETGRARPIAPSRSCAR